MSQETMRQDKMNQNAKTSFQLNDVRREKSLVNVPKKESRKNVKRLADFAVSSRRKAGIEFYPKNNDKVYTRTIYSFNELYQFVYFSIKTNRLIDERKLPCIILAWN